MSSPRAKIKEEPGEFVPFVPDGSFPLELNDLEQSKDPSEKLKLELQEAHRTNDVLKKRLRDLNMHVWQLKFHKEIHIKYIERVIERESAQSDRLRQELKTLREENGELQRKIDEERKLIGPFREHLVAYEAEKTAMLTRKRARNIELKYAQLLGHEDLNQKIKHLESQNIALNETNKELEARVRAQARTIEKLNKELAALSSSPRKSKILNKENIPNRTLNGNLPSPGPFRQRN